MGHGAAGLTFKAVRAGHRGTHSFERGRRRPSVAVYFAAASLDGFIADADDGVGFLDSVPQPSEDTYAPFIDTIGALAMGRASYEFLLRHIEGGGEWPYTLPTWVFTHKAFPPRDGVTFVQGDVAIVHAQMAKHGKVWVVGGGELAGQFLDAGLLDEMVITIASVTLGAGKPLLPRDARWKLTSTRPLGEGFAELRYRLTDRPAPAEEPAGPPGS